MERKTVLTLIKRNHMNLGDEFMLGKIIGIGYCMSGFNRGYVLMHTDDGFIYKHKFTVDEYDKFINEIDKIYQRLCIFDNKVDWESIFVFLFFF